MPQLEHNLWIEGGYYIDFDELDQFRIIGPNNELYLGLIDIPQHKFAIKQVTASEHGGVVDIAGAFTAHSINLYHPTMDDIRTIRELTTHPHGHKISFLELRRNNPSLSIPNYVRRWAKANKKHLLFQRNYGNFWYRTEWEFPETVSIAEINRPYKGYRLTAKNGSRIAFHIRASTNEIDRMEVQTRLLPKEALDWSVFGQQRVPLQKFWERTEQEIKHLLTWKKTSGDRFGTIFPRDWMESILLGAGDLRPETIDGMMYACLNHVDTEGHGWHEDVVGEYKYEHELGGKDIFDRKMVDIEPLYLLCLPYVSAEFWKNKKAIEKLKRVTRYVLKKARTKNFITFKKYPKRTRTPDHEYYRVGDWRDSAWAYKQINPIIAPFGVNAALYPLALVSAAQFAKRLGVPAKSVNLLLKKWGRTKEWYEFHDEKGNVSHALALFDVKTHNKKGVKKLRVKHLDEAYLYALGEGTEREITQFARNLLSANVFFTKSGPTVVAQQNNYGYTSVEYHGVVVWAKQAALAIAALNRHRKIAAAKPWKPQTKKIIDEALEKTCSATLRAFTLLGAIPELHYDKDGMPHFFTDQTVTYGGMSKVQLWSAVGYRKIVRDYYDYLTQKQA